MGVFTYTPIYALLNVRMLRTLYDKDIKNIDIWGYIQTNTLMPLSTQLTKSVANINSSMSGVSLGKDRTVHTALWIGTEVRSGVA